MSRDYDHTPVGLLSGKEPFTAGGKPLGLSVLDFWSFQRSNLWDIDYKGKRVEVKETGYYYSWQKDGKISEQRSFGITKAYSKYKDTSSAFERQNDVYVFCLNTGRTKEESNPLEMDHWRFWVVPTSVINRECGDNKTLGLNRLRRIVGNDDGLRYEELKDAIDKALMV